MNVNISMVIVHKITVVNAGDILRLALNAKFSQINLQNGAEASLTNCLFCHETFCQNSPKAVNAQQY